MSSITTTTSTSTHNPASAAQDVASSTEKLLATAEKCHVKPLWAQMNRLNPPLPNPRCKPHVWEYKTIRPNLLEAGRLITEKQAERRVLMLVNPERGTLMLAADVGPG